MEWREKLGLAAVCAMLISLGLALYDVWPVLVAHLTLINGMMIALVELVCLACLISLYAKAPKGTRVRTERLFITAFVIMTWSMSFVLMGKIGGR